MDPQPQQQQQPLHPHPHPHPNQPQHPNPDTLISMMRITKKTDPLFKPLKKLKTALDNIGYDKISLKPTKIIILFHFGLGNDHDLQFIKQTYLKQQIIKNNPILPGKSYCYLNFTSQQQSSQYYKYNYMPILQKYPTIGYKQIQYQKLLRILICMYINISQFLSQPMQQINIPNTSLNYIPQTIPGIKIIQQFLTKQQQFQLLQQIDKKQWNKLNNRRVQHYGYQFKYGKNGIDKDQKYQKPMPQFIQPILQKLKNISILPYTNFDQMTINDYFSGDGIPAHFDTHSPFQQYFIAISILSGIVMQWRKYDGTQKQTYLPARSLVIFSGQGRYAWTHGISCRKIDKIQGELRYRSRRISITLRKIKYTPCQCIYYYYCDSQGYDQNTMKKNNVLLVKYMAQNIHKKKLENISQEEIYKRYVLDAYEGFGFDFHNKAISCVEKIIGEYFQGIIVNKKEQIQIQIQTINILDVGCGNGQYKDLLQQKYSKLIQTHKIFYQYFGIQICQTMKYFQDKIHMDGLSLCFRQKSFDLILCIAVLHHMTKYQQRLKMLQEIYKVLTHQGILILTVFGYQQKSNIYKDQDILLQYCVPQHKVNQSQNQNQKMQENQENLIVRKQKRGKVYQRYYHLFKLDEIRELLKNAKFQILYEETDKENIIIKAQKRKIN